MIAKTIASSCGAAVMFSLAGAATIWAAGMAPASAETLFNVTNLVSDGAVPAKLVDPNLINPWGIAMSPTSPFWISDNGTGLATIYSVSANNSSVSKLGLTVTIPPAAGSPGSAPTGQVFNGGAGFAINGSSTHFLFDSEDGAISGWSGGTNAAIAVDHSGMNSVYKGLAIDDTNSLLFASDFHNGDIEKYNNNFTQIIVPGSFTDPSLPAGYAPFNLKVINGDLYVTYAVQNAEKHDDVAGPGNGLVDVFDLNGNFVKRLISPGGELNSPWGLLIAPSSFGSFAGDLLVGNFGDGMIDAYNASTGAFIDVLRGSNDLPISITDLWALSLGNGGMAGSPNSLYFTAGLVDEGDGLFGALTAVPEPSTWAMLLLGFGGLGLVAMQRRRAPVTPA